MIENAQMAKNRFFMCVMTGMWVSVSAVYIPYHVKTGNVHGLAIVLAFAVVVCPLSYYLNLLKSKLASYHVFLSSCSALVYVISVMGRNETGSEYFFLLILLLAFLLFETRDTKSLIISSVSSFLFWVALEWGPIDYMPDSAMVDVGIIPVVRRINYIFCYVSISLCLFYFKRLINELNRKNCELEEISLRSANLAAVGELASGVGHEINNPLMVVSGALYHLERSETYRSEDELRWLGMIERAYQQISGIVGDLKTFAYNSYNEHEEVDIAELVSSSIGFVGDILEKSGVRTCIEIKGEHILVCGSRGKIQQVITNLVMNSRDAMEKSEEKRINVTVSRDKRWAYIAVKDFGEGVDEEIKDRIFNPFFTTKSIGKGTGLGLSMCQSIIAGIGGSISLESAGEGATFTVKIPLIKGSAVSKKKV